MPRETLWNLFTEDVGAARRAVVQEDDGECRAREHTADDERHELLSLAQYLDVVAVVVLRDDFLRDAQHERENDDGVDGLDEEAPSQNLQAHDKQQGVDEEVGVADGDACGIEDDGADTRHAARDNLVGKEKDGESKRVQ